MLRLTRGAAVASDVATAGQAGRGVTQEATEPAAGGQALPVAGSGVTPLVGAPDGPGHLGMRRRLGRFAAARGGGVNPVLEPLIKTVRATHPKADVRLIERAYEAAARCHAGQSRKSGDPYITHPLAVATILAELGMNHETIAAALLHDTVEDTPYTLGELRRDFGDEIAMLVDGVTKLDRVKYGEAAQAETVRKMVVAMSRDIRVLVIKLADRLHNMRTLRYLPRPKQERIARETLEIYAPLAHRMGMNTIKWELEDLAFMTLFPKRYQEIARLVSERAPRREAYLQEVIDEVAADLREARIKARVTGRPKHLYSIYQSLHTTVIGPGGKPVELQIRTRAMHRRSEYGVAAHWKYKEERNNGRSPADMDWLRQLVDWQRETEDPADFLEWLRFEVGSAEVYVFTPRGEVIALPLGATPVDFAYAIHTEVGHRTVGAKVNGRLVPLESQLSNGDTVEILTSKAPDAGPSQDWLGFVKSARARNKIRHWFSRERREAAAETGKAMIARAMRKQGLPLQRLATADALQSIALDLRYQDLSALYAAVGDGHVSAQSVVAKLVRSAGGLAGAQEDLAEATMLTRPSASPLVSGDSGVAVEGLADVWARLSKCCTPVPGDAITGFVTRGNGVSVHRADCANVQHLIESQPERLVSVRWSPKESSRFLAAIQVEALDRTGLLSDITRSISEQHVNILSATVTTRRDRVALSKFTFEMGDPQHLRHVLRAVRLVDGVYDAHRVTH